MPASKSSRAKAEKIVRQQAALERRGVRAAASIGYRAQLAFFRHLSNPQGVAAVTAFKNELMKGVDTLAGAMVTAHLSAMKMVVDAVPKRHSLRLSSVFDASTSVLQTQLAMTDQNLGLMVAQYGDNARTILSRASSLAARKIQSSMLSIQIQGLHVAGGKEVLRRTFASLGFKPANSYTLENIYRTQIQTAYSAGRWNMNRDPAIQEILWGYEYVTAGDTRVRPTHAGMEGVKLRKTDPFWKINYPPNGYSCFVPTTRVSGEFLAGSKADYSGPAIELETARGHRLTVTANHPVLTGKGWVSASSIKEGDALLSDSRHAESIAPYGTEPNDQNAPSRIKDVFDSFLAHRRVTIGTVQVSPLDYYGDGQFIEGNVHIVNADRPLPEHVIPGGAKESQQGQFVGSDVRSACLHRLGHLELGRQLAGRSLHGLPRGGALALDKRSILFDLGPLSALGIGSPSNVYAAIGQELSNWTARYAQRFSELLHALSIFVFPNDHGRASLQSMRCGLAADWHVVATKEDTDRASSDSEFCRQMLSRSSGAVSLDRIRSVRRFEYVGHVYDLQSRTGWILANGVVASNCRCQAIEIFDSPDELGGEQRPPSTFTTTIDGNEVTVVPGADDRFRFNPGEVFGVSLN